MRSCLAKEREHPPLCPHPPRPLLGLVELLWTRQGLGVAPRTVQRADSVRADDLVREGLPAPVLGELHVEAEDLGDDRVEQAAALAVRVEGAPQLAVAGIE